MAKRVLKPKAPTSTAAVLTNADLISLDNFCDSASLL